MVLNLKRIFPLSRFDLSWRLIKFGKVASKNIAETIVYSILV